MQRILSITLALFIGLTFSYDAEARRFGGGKSFGSAPKHQQAKPQQRQQQQAQPGQQSGRGNAAASSGAANLRNDKNDSPVTDAYRLPKEQ